VSGSYEAFYSAFYTTFIFFFSSPKRKIKIERVRKKRGKKENSTSIAKNYLENTEVHSFAT